jgi:hypothetical protein
MSCLVLSCLVLSCDNGHMDIDKDRARRDETRQEWTRIDKKTKTRPAAEVEETDAGYLSRQTMTFIIIFLCVFAPIQTKRNTCLGLRS